MLEVGNSTAAEQKRSISHERLCSCCEGKVSPGEGVEMRHRQLGFFYRTICCALKWAGWAVGLVVVIPRGARHEHLVDDS